PLAWQARALSEPQPEREPTLALLRPVVIHDAPQPHAPELWIFRLGHDDRVLDRNSRLIVVAILDPELQRPSREPSFVHAQVERMMIVIAARSLGAQPLDQIAHRAISRPSRAISQPAVRARVCSGEPFRSIGLVLLMCV